MKPNFLLHISIYSYFIFQKCYKRLYKNKDTPGTLHYFKTLLHRSNINGIVKGRFRPHHDLLMVVGEAMVKEQFLEFFQMEDKDSSPIHDLLADIVEKTEEEQKQLLLNTLAQFIEYYGYCKCDKGVLPQDLQAVEQYQLQIADQTLMLVPQLVERKDDRLYNYCMQLCHWYMHIAEMNDTAKEGDLNRAVLNSQYCLPFFYSHSALSKYLVENIDYILKSEVLSSPLQRIRILEGSFTNCHGGIGKNVESDLVQEHSVCNQKKLIKSLGANKSEQAISRVTKSADAIHQICSNFDASIELQPKSGRHSKPFSEVDETRLHKILRKLRPFHYTSGRTCDGFNVDPVPLKSQDISKLEIRLNQIITRLTRGRTISTEEEDQQEENEISDTLPPL